MSNDDRLKFILRVLEAYTAHGPTETLSWRTDGKFAPITFYVICNDTFYWGSSDAEDITPENIDVFEQSLADCKALNDKQDYPELSFETLFVARSRQLRPQGAMYAHLPKSMWPLLDAAGPERPTDLGNPMTPEQAWDRLQERITAKQNAK